VGLVARFFDSKAPSRGSPETADATPAHGTQSTPGGPPTAVPLAKVAKTVAATVDATPAHGTQSTPIAATRGSAAREARRDGHQDGPATVDSGARRTSQLTRDDTPARKLFPVRDRAGIIVALSTRPPRRDESAADHARHLLKWVVEQYGVAGQPVLAEVLQHAYAIYCKQQRLAPFAWRTVAGHLKQLTGIRKHYRWIGERRNRSRRRVYLMPAT